MSAERSTKSSRGSLKQRIEASKPGELIRVAEDEKNEMAQLMKEHEPPAPKKTLIPHSVYLYNAPLFAQSRNKFFVYRATMKSKLRDFKIFIDDTPHMKDQQKLWITVDLNRKEVIDQLVVHGENSFGDGTIELQAGDLVEIFFSTNVEPPMEVKQINIVFTQEV